MPLYEYQCLPHSHRFEVRHGFNEEPVTECPQCAGPVRRVIHPVGIVFKGSGFYATDSRKPSSKTESTAPGSREKKTESKAESKPDSKSD